MSNQVFRPRTILLVIILLILAAAAYGFAATNTVNDSYAGDGSGTVNGFTVSNIHYTLDTSAAPNIYVGAVEFDLAGPAVLGANASALVQLSSGSWYTCDTTTSVTHDMYCDLSSGTEAVGAAFTSLRVVAAE
jgi:hypothetical protein